jgi:hypothetical protein
MFLQSIIPKYRKNKNKKSNQIKIKSKYLGKQ